MTDKGTAVIDDLLDALEEAGYAVVEVGARYRVTSPKGGFPVFLPKRMPKGANLTKIVESLANIGFSMADAVRVAEEKRQARLAEDKAKAERLMKAAQEAQLQRELDAQKKHDEAAKRKLEPVTFRAPEEVGHHRAVAAESTGLTVIRTKEPVTLRSEVIDLTPTIAQEMLKANQFYEAGVDRAGKCNRRLVPATAEAYAQAMLRGEWVLTHQGIGFDIDGDLADGQHRLVACVLAGHVKPDISVPMLVTYGLPLEAADRVDVGRKRTISDMLQMRGFASSFNLGSTCRVVILYDELMAGPDDRAGQAVLGRWRTAYPTAEQTFALIEREPLIEASSRYGHRMSKVALPSAAGAARHIVGRHWPEDMADDFFERLHSGASIEPGSALHSLREELIRQKGLRNFKRNQFEQLALMIKAWNLHARGKGSKVMVWRPSVGEEFPEILTPSPAR
jgi:hypothetical protein